MALTVDIEFDRGCRTTYSKSLSDTPLPFQTLFRSRCFPIDKCCAEKKWSGHARQVSVFIATVCETVFVLFTYGCNNITIYRYIAIFSTIIQYNIVIAVLQYTAMTKGPESNN